MEILPIPFFCSELIYISSDTSVSTQMDVLSNYIKTINNYFENNPKNVSLIWGCCFFILISCLDYQASPNISLSIFYLLPISLITWFVSRKAGFIICALSGLAGFATKFPNDYTENSILVPFWNATVMLIIFLTIASLLLKLREVLKQGQELARIDGTTGIANKRLFFELTGTELKKSQRYRHPLTVIYFDIDDFQNINKDFGHQVGDRLLHTVAQTLAHSIRDTDVIGRIGGDEFAILLPGSGYQPARIVIYRVQSELLAAMEENQWTVTFSIGAVTFINPPDSVDAMIQQADHLMYLAKNNGKNQLKHKTSI
jgi:diguanylate cyclase (GGDEF)-like protein